MKNCGRCKIEKPLDAFYREKPHGTRAGRVSSYCTECKLELRRIWYAENTEYARKASAAYAKANPERMKNYNFIRKFGETRDAILAHHPRHCGICEKTDPGTKGWQIDHDHETGKVRGVLCTGCNTALGKLGDSVTGLQRAIAYLERAADRESPMLLNTDADEAPQVTRP